MRNVVAQHAEECEKGCNAVVQISARLSFVPFCGLPQLPPPPPRRIVYSSVASQNCTECCGNVHRDVIRLEFPGHIRIVRNVHQLELSRCTLRFSSSPKQRLGRVQTMVRPHPSRRSLGASQTCIVSRATDTCIFVDPTCRYAKRLLGLTLFVSLCMSAPQVAKRTLPIDTDLR